MSSAVPFSSILFDRPSDAGERGDPSMFADLNLDQVFAAVVAGRDEYDLMPFFRAPLRGQDLYQQVFGTADTEARV